MTDKIMRDGTSCSNHSLTALVFNNIHELMRAAHCLKNSGFDILVAPRRTANCGAVVLVASESVTVALTTLKTHDIAPEEITDYPLKGGVH